MQKRLVLTMLMALLIASFLISIYTAIEQHVSLFGFLLLGTVVLPLNLALPLSLCGMVFYHEIRKMKKISLETVIRITLRFILICELICTLWAAAGLITFGHIKGFWRTYKQEFFTWNLVVLIVGLLVPFLFFNRKFLKGLKRRA
jgi:hypothetical protein